MNVREPKIKKYPFFPLIWRGILWICFSDSEKIHKREKSVEISAT